MSFLFGGVITMFALKIYVIFMTATFLTAVGSIIYVAACFGAAVSR